MQIVAPLFVEQFDMRQIPGPSTRFDIGGAYLLDRRWPSFPPCSIPHLLVFVHAPPDDSGNAHVRGRVHPRRRADRPQRAAVPGRPGKFGFRLVKPEFEFTEPGIVEATCTLTESGSSVTVPLTVLQAPPP